MKEPKQQTQEAKRIYYSMKRKYRYLHYGATERVDKIQTDLDEWAKKGYLLVSHCSNVHGMGLWLVAHIRDEKKEKHA